MKKILLIGASGFVGKSLIEYFGDNDKYFSKIYTISRKSFSLKKKYKSLKKIKIDLIKLKKFPEIDYIMYLINSNGHKSYVKNFSKFKKLIGNLKYKPSILFLSSGAVYGKRKKKYHISEKFMVKTNKNNNYKNYKKKYALEKIYLEKKFQQLSKNGYKVSIARCFTFYGNYILSYKYAISNILNSIIRKKKTIVFDKNPNIYRSYMHSDDMCKWLLKIIKNSNVNCPIYNVGSNKEINMLELATFFSNRYNIKLKSKNYDLNEIEYYVPSTEYATKDLGLKSSVSFKNGIKKILSNL